MKIEGNVNIRDGREGNTGFVRGILLSPNILVLLILAVLLIFCILSTPLFLKPRNLSNVFLRQPIGFGIASLAQLVVVLTGCIDLSIGAVISLLTSLTAGLYQARPDTPVYQAVLLIIGCGLVIGAINGTVAVYLRVTPFMATLATMSIFQGAALFYLKKTIGGIPRTFRFIADGKLGGIPFSIILFVVIMAIMWVLLKRHKFGRHMYAVGSDPYVSTLSGIAVGRVRFLAYVLGGALVAAASLYLAARMGGGGPKVGGEYEMDTITAIVIGGVSLAGGAGNIFSAFGGVLIISVFSNIMNLLNVNAFMQIVLKGVVLILAVSFYSKKRN